MPSLQRVAVVAAALLTSTVAFTPPAAAAGLPLGDPDLPEARTTERLADGVTLTRIVRGDEPAAPEDIPTTTRGPWRVNVLTIDPDRADGRIEATVGPSLAPVEKTSELVDHAGAVAGVNASFFTFTANPAYPGDPVGLGLYDGDLLSEPAAAGDEVDFVVDSDDDVLIGHLTWAGSMRNRSTGAVLPLEFLNHPPVVPAACAELDDQTQCPQPGDVVQFSPKFGASTPPGRGVEVVLDRRGCVVRTTTTRGIELAAGQSSLQATGADTNAVLNAVAGGCMSRSLTVRDEAGKRLALHRGLHGVNGRYRLTAGGQIVVPPGSGSFFARNPRTIAGTTRGGRILLVTIDGRQSTSVGTTMDETAAVAHALGMHDAVNLDGGGSTTMATRAGVVNQPSGGVQRAVGDALVYVE